MKLSRNKGYNPPDVSHRLKHAVAETSFSSAIEGSDMTTIIVVSVLLLILLFIFFVFLLMRRTAMEFKEGVKGK